MSIILQPEQYYHSLALFLLAKIKEREVNRLDKELSSILQDKTGRSGDSIYDPESEATTTDFDNLLKRLGIEVEWIKKEEVNAKEETSSVG